MRFVPLSVNWDYNGVSEICGISRLFEEIEEGELTPEYEITITNKDRDIIDVEAKRK